MYLSKNIYVILYGNRSLLLRNKWNMILIAEKN